MAFPFDLINTTPNRINILSRGSIKTIYDSFKKGSTKARLARVFNVSPDTITRAIENGEEYYKTIYGKSAAAEQPVGKTLSEQLMSRMVSNPNRLYKTQSEINTLLEIDEKPLQTLIDLEPNTNLETEQPKSSKPTYTITNDSICIVMPTDSSGTVRVYTCDDSNKHFEQIKHKILKDDFIGAIELITPSIKLVNFSRGLITIKNSVVYYKNEPISNSLTKLIINKIINKSDDYERLINFMSKLMNNPSNKAVNRLFDFMQHNDIKILKDGNIVTLKSVGHNYLDLYSNTVLNKPGMTIRMERCMVDDDDTNTCSHGYHVGSVGYVKGYGNSSSRYLACIVDPAHVVSIPVDHNDMKCRVSEYYVDKEFTLDEVSSGEYLNSYE